MKRSKFFPEVRVLLTIYKDVISAHFFVFINPKEEFPPGERMQQVGEKWWGLTEAKQLKYNDIEFLNKLRQAIRLAEADNPEDIEEEDRDAAGEINTEFLQARAENNRMVAPAVKVQQAIKSGAKALSVCKKWINGVTKKVCFIISSF